MFKRSDLLAALAAVTCAAASATVTPLPDDKARAGYQLRCWQEGRLMFEENAVTLPAGAKEMRVVAIDRSGRPILLVESGNASCVLRHLEERPESR